jgi:ethanolamine permease
VIAEAKQLRLDRSVGNSPSPAHSANRARTHKSTMTASIVSVDIQDPSLSKPGHRYAKVPHLWAMGIGAVISGEYYGWQSTLVAGFDGLLILLSMMTVLYVTLSFSIAELSATIPAGGGPYVFARHAIGPRAAFFSGLAEALKVIAVNSSTFYTIYSYLDALFDLDDRYSPLFFVGFGLFFTGLNIMGVVASFRMQVCSTLLCVLLLVIFYIAAIPHLDYNQWVVQQDWKFTNWSDTITAIPFAMWFYLGIEELPLASEETINPEKNVPRALVITMITLVILSFCTAVFSSLIFPGAAEVANVSAPLVTGFQTVFGDGHTLTFFKWMTIIALTSSPNAYIFFMAQLLFAVARDGYFPKYLAKEHPTRGTPVGALVVGGSLTVAIAVILHYVIGDEHLGSVLINLTLFGGLISYIFQLVSFIMLRIRQPDRPRPYRCPFGIPGAVIGLVVCAISFFAIIYSGVQDTDFLASVGTTVVVFIVGAVYYFKWVEPRIDKMPLVTPMPMKDMREVLLSSGSAAGYQTRLSREN